MNMSQRPNPGENLLENGVHVKCESQMTSAVTVRNNLFTRLNFAKQENPSTDQDNVSEN
jgi:hypothetical protein